MSIVGCLVRAWMSLTILAVAINFASVWLVDHLPAARSVSEANIYLDVFMISAPAPIVLVPVLTVVGGLWGLLRALSRLVQRSQDGRRLDAAGLRMSPPRHRRA
jgi:hypothetical protein